MFTSVYKTKELNEISDRISNKVIDEGGNTGAGGKYGPTIHQLQEDIEEITTQVCFMNSVIRSQAQRIRVLEDSLPLIGI